MALPDKKPKLKVKLQGTVKVEKKKKTKKNG